MRLVDARSPSARPLVLTRLAHAVLGRAGPAGGGVAGALSRLRALVPKREAPDGDNSLKIRRSSPLTSQLFLLALIASIPAFAVLAVNEFDLRRSREAELRELAMRNARQAQAEIERVFEGVENLLQAVAQTPAVRSFETQACAAYLRSLLARVPHLKSLSVLDITGRVQCQDWSPRDEQRYQTLGYFRDALATKRFVVGAYTAGRDGGGVLPVAQPLLQANGTFYGVVVASLDLAWLKTRLTDRGLAPGSALTVADKSEVILFGEPAERSVVGMPLSELHQRLAQAPRSGTRALTGEDGERRIVGFIPAAGSNGVHVFSESSFDVAFAALDRNASRSTAVMIASLIAALIVTWIIGRLFIERPLRRLVDTAAAWRGGDVATRTRMRPDRGEIEAVGAAFDRLLDEVASQQAETEREAKAHAESERRYRSLIELSPDAEFVEVDGRFVYANAAMLRLVDVEAEALTGRPVLDFVHEEDRRLVRERMAQLKRTGEPNPAIEQRWQRPDGTVLDVEVVSAPVPWGGRQANQVILRDIAARKQAEARQDILMHELNHRVKNTLATVQSLALQTLRTAPSIAHFRKAFIARLISLSATQNLLTQKAWDHAPLRELIRTELTPYGEERFTLRGPDVLLPPRVALPLGMVLHELTTNAAKYGALVSANGEVSLEWTYDRPTKRLDLVWRERNGPPVERPSREGFGSTLIERTIVGELDGRYERMFDPAGLVCTIAVSLHA